MTVLLFFLLLFFLPAHFSQPSELKQIHEAPVGMRDDGICQSASMQIKGTRLRSEFFASDTSYRWTEEREMSAGGLSHALALIL